MDKPCSEQLPQGCLPLRYIDFVAREQVESKAFEKVEAERSGTPMFYFPHGSPFSSSHSVHPTVLTMEVEGNIVHASRFRT